MFHNLLYPQFCHTASHKQYVSNRWCDRSYGKIHNHHNTKVDRTHSKALYDRKEDRCENQKCRRHIHKCSHDQKENIEDQQDHIFITWNSKNQFTDCCRQPCKGHYKWQYRRCSDDQHNDCCHNCCIHQQLRNFTQFDRSVNKHREDKGVCNRNTGCLCRCKFSR